MGIQERQLNAFDVVSVGSDVGGLVAATLLARAGRSTLLLKERGYASVFTREGYRFVPFSNFSERRVRGNSLKLLLRLFKLPSFRGTRRGKEVSSVQRRQAVPFQVILPGARVDLFWERTQQQKEWRREFPREIARVEQFYATLDQQREQLRGETRRDDLEPFFPARSSSFLSRWRPPEPSQDLSPFSREIRAFVELQTTAWGNLRSDRWPISLMAHLLSAGEREEPVWDVDLEELQTSVLREYVRAGGLVEEIERVEGVSKGWRTDYSILLGGGKRTIRSRFLILSAPLHRLALHLPGPSGRRLAAWTKRVKPRYVIYPLYLGLREKVIPVGMRDFLVSVRDLEGPHDQGNLLYVALSPKKDEAWAPEGRRTLTAGSLIPWKEYGERWNPDLLQRHQQAVMDHLREKIPFLDDHVEFIESGPGQELISHWSYPHFLYETSSPFHWREGILPPRVSRSLYVAGRENFPYLGLEGEILSGGMVAGHILRK